MPSHHSAPISSLEIFNENELLNAETVTLFFFMDAKNNYMALWFSFYAWGDQRKVKGFFRYTLKHTMFYPHNKSKIKFILNQSVGIASSTPFANDNILTPQFFYKSQETTFPISPVIPVKSSIFPRHFFQPI